MSTAERPKLTRKDFASSQEVRWCPGCGDYAILNAVQQALAEMDVPRENHVFLSGIGCSSRFPYYMNTYGFHTIHGRAPSIATGLKLSRPDLTVWVATGDGDALSIGGNHLIHALRRNVSLKILMFNNRIYGLTKGQYSPTSERGKHTASTPFGSVDPPFNPVALALGSEATFVARSVDRYSLHLRGVLRRAAEHRGAAFVEIFQNCNIFNDGAFLDVTEKKVKDDRTLMLAHGEPLIFGKELEKGIRLADCFTPEVVPVAEVGPEKLLRHDEHRRDSSLAYMLARMGHPEFPVPLGVFRDAEAPTLEESISRQIEGATEKLGPGDLAALLRGGDTWKVS
jgi:2-oxoglutarate ferredoxin oxidoreductase subunit beta